MLLPELRTARLRLRPFGAGDVDAIHALWTDPGVRRFLWDDRVIGRERAAHEVASALRDEAEGGFGLWTLHLREVDGVIGFCGFRRMHEADELELLYGLLPEHWGQGLAVEASRAALEQLFAACSAQRVYALANPPNAQSFRVMEKLGMRFDRDGEAGGRPARFYVLEVPGSMASR